MTIKRIHVKNFKSFKDVEVEFGKFNVLIGANASGKSNFVQIFQFLRDITRFGLDNAISMQGGVEYLRNINIGASQNLAVEIVSDQKFRFGREFGFRRETEEGLIGIEADEMAYEFAMKFKKKGLEFEITKDKLTQRCDFVRLEKKKEKIEKKEKVGEGEIIFSCANRKVKIDLNKPAKVPIKEDDIIPPFLRDEELPPNTLLLEIPLFFPFPSEWGKVFRNMSIYDFDPKLPKKATPITGKAELEEDGSNLSIVLKNIIEDKDKKRKLFNLVSNILPFIDNLDVEKFADKSLLFKLREKYYEKDYLPASLISDGTINITALIIALYFEERPLAIIEEPGRNVHPYLISKMVNMMKDASRQKQIIVTTHNPEIVKYADLENILLVSRDKEGFSTISRPAHKEKVKIFLKNKIGVEELYVRSLLEV